jgi:hypothetical protein
MKKSIVMFLVIALALAGPLLAIEKATLKVKAVSANVRSGPDASAAIIARLTAGTVLEVFGREGSWFEIRVNDGSGKEIPGYIHQTVVDVSGEVEEKAGAEPRDVFRQTAVRSYARGGFKLMGGLCLGNGTMSATLPPEIVKASKLDFNGGVGFETGGIFAFEADLMYSPGGVIVKSADPSETGRITFSGYAITMPLMLKLRFLRGATPYILAGGEVGYIMTGKMRFKYDNGTTSEADVIDLYERLLYGVVFGGGFEMKAGQMSVFLEARYRLGLSNQLKDPDHGDYVRITSLAFWLGIRF